MTSIDVLRDYSQTIVEHSKQLREQAEAARLRSSERRVVAEQVRQRARDLHDHAASAAKAKMSIHSEPAARGEWGGRFGRFLDRGH